MSGRKAGKAVPGTMSLTSGIAPEVESADPGERMVKMSVKVPVSDHRALARDRIQMSEDLGGQRVTDQDVMSTLLALMVDDPALRRDVTEALRK